MTKNDFKDLVKIITIFILITLGIGLLVNSTYNSSCEELENMPAKQLPARCINYFMEK